MTLKSRSRAMVVLSGGQDSTTCLYWARKLYREVHAVTFDYGQRHYREVQAATQIADMAGLPAGTHHVVKLGPILKGTSPLVSDEKLEQYKDHASLPGGLEKTFVPMRNQLFLTVAANRAFVEGINVIVTGVCQEDFGGYPDCRRTFINALQKASSLGTFNSVAESLPLKIETPLMYLTKAKSVKLAMKLPGCYAALAYSHTSYDGAYPPTGKDHATLLRAKGFEEANVPDPLVLRAWQEGKMPLPETDNYMKVRLNKYLNLMEAFT